MNIKINYYPITEVARFENDKSDPKLWSDFYRFIQDYIPSDLVNYSDNYIYISWRLFLSIINELYVFLRSHNKSLKYEFTETAKEKLKGASSNSYNVSIERDRLSKEEVVNKLNLLNFSQDRPVTDNQISNLTKIVNLPGAATFSVPGAGKTTEALAFFFLNASDNDRLLVVAPKNAFGSWDEQLKVCMKNIDDQFIRLRGGENVIIDLLSKKPRFMIISYEQIIKVKDVIINEINSSNVFMFLDESHRIKGGKNVKRAEAILEMSHLPKRKLIMSGTPMPQSPKDLVSQFSFLYPSKKVDENNVIDLFQPIYVRTTKEQLGIPEVSHKVITVRMTDLQREIYQVLKSKVKAELNPNISDLSKYELKKIGRSIMKIMEFVSNPTLLVNDMNYIFDNRVGELLLSNKNPKIDYVCSRARELAQEGKKVIIWSCFVQNVELIALRLKDLGAEYIHGGVDAGDEESFDTREGKIKRFHDDPTCMVLVANPAACSEGISLHKVCQYAIYLDRSFNSAHYLQSEDRIHRLGLSPDANPIVEFVECEDSIDQVIRERLTLKVDRMANALNDPSLKITPAEFINDYDDDEEEFEGIDSEDAKSIITFFFGDNKC